MNVKIREIMKFIFYMNATLFNYVIFFLNNVNANVSANNWKSISFASLSRFYSIFKYHFRSVYAFCIFNRAVVNNIFHPIFVLYLESSIDVYRTTFILFLIGIWQLLLKLNAVLAYSFLVVFPCIYRLFNA